VEVDRTVNRSGSVSLGQHLLLAAEVLGGRRVGIRIDARTLSFFDLQTRQLLRTRSVPGRSSKLKGASRRKRRPSAALDLGASATVGQGVEGRPMACPHSVRTANPVIDSARLPLASSWPDTRLRFSVGR
jgi:hypothetical protein